MRLFVGIPLGDALVAELERLCGRVRKRDEGLRWSAPESWHITLQFLGNTVPEKYECLTSHLAAVRAAPVPVHLGGLGFFDRAGVFFAEVDPTPELTAAQQRVTEATRHCGFVPEERPFRPHITLVRAKQGQSRALKDLKTRVGTQPEFSSFIAHEFLLYESHLGAGGSKYEVRARFALRV